MEVVTRRYGEMMRDDVVKLEIGPDHVEYFVHPGLLLQHSEYFKRALNGNWKEAAERAIRLDDVDCKTFEIFLEWLYTQQYPKNGRFYDELNLNTTMQLARVKACEFGDRFQATGFLKMSESALVDSLILGRQVPYYETIIYAYDYLQPNSLVLQALIDTHCYFWHEGSDTEENGELELRFRLPHSFLLGVAFRYMRLQHGRKKRLNRCNYHGYGLGDEKEDRCQVMRVDDFENKPAHQGTT